MTQALKIKCVAKTSKGKPCQKWAIKGATVCRSHGGASGHVRVRAAVRAEVMTWGFTEQTIDPGEFLLRLVTQSAARCVRYAAELEKLVEEAPSLREALVAETWIPTEHGESYKAGEYIRGLAQLEAQERDRGAGFATKAIAAGLAERTVRIAERQGQMMVDMVQAALKEVSLTSEQETAFKAALARQVRAIGAA